MNQESRCNSICRAMNEINRCISQRGQIGNEMATLGEIDWLWELHRLLYEENA